MYKFLEVLAGAKGDAYRIIGDGAYLQSQDGRKYYLKAGDIVYYQHPIINDDVGQSASCIFSTEDMRFEGVLHPEDSYDKLIDKVKEF